MTIDETFEPVYDASSGEVRGRDYVITRKGSELKAPFADIFHYQDEHIDFFFRASRFAVDMHGDTQFIDNDEYVIDGLWKSDDEMRFDKAKLQEDDQLRALENIVDAMHYMWSGQKQPPSLVRVALRRLT